MVSENNGTALSLVWICNNNHIEARWSSQPLLKYSVSIGNFLFCTSVVLSGNTLAHSKLLFKALNIKTVSKSYFYRIQFEIVAPKINEAFTEMMASVRKSYQDKPNVVMADGANDSPGHKAKYCIYSVMEYFSKDILAMVIIDKRHTKPKSTNMETCAFVEVMKYLKENVNVVEMVTDAHAAISAKLSCQ